MVILSRYTSERIINVLVVVLVLSTTLSSSIVTASHSNLRFGHSGLWKVHGRHGRSLLWGLDSSHKSGTPYSRSDNSLIVSASEADIRAAFQLGKTFPVPLPFSGLGECEFELMPSNLLSEGYAASVGDSSANFRARAVPNASSDEATRQLCKGATAVFDFGALGLHGMILTNDKGIVFIDPYTLGERTTYSIYSRLDDSVPRDTPLQLSLSKKLAKMSGGGTTPNPPSPLHHWACDVSEEVSDHSDAGRKLMDGDNSPVTPRTIRVAVASTTDFAKYFGGKDGAIAAVKATVTRVSMIYERDFAVTLQLVGDAQKLSPTSTSEGGLSAERDSNTFLTRIHKFIAEVTPDSDYDLGHMLTAQVNGLARLRSLCVSQLKGMGVSGSPKPVADAFQVDYVAHEMGHQFGASHTMIGSNCGQVKSQTLMVEPGSGSTIMAYAGLCYDDDLQKNTDAFMHARSVFEIQALLSSKPTCGIISDKEYQRPPLEVPSNVLKVPMDTPFELTVSNRNENYLYAWDQIDSENTLDFLRVSRVIGGRFRSYFPRTQSYRKWFPSRELMFASNPNEDLADDDGDIVSLSKITVSVAEQAESLPKNTGLLSFAVTARSSNPELARAISSKVVDVQVEGSGPFALRYPASSEDVVYTNSTNTIRWEVAGTDAYAPDVSILLSFDDGETFDYAWGTNIPNTGSAVLFMDGEVCEQYKAVQKTSGKVAGARLMVSSAPNGLTDGAPTHHFFAVTTERLNIDCIGLGLGFTPLLIGLAGAGAAILFVTPVVVLVRKRQNAAVANSRQNFVDPQNAVEYYNGNNKPSALPRQQQVPVAVAVSRGEGKFDQTNVVKQQQPSGKNTWSISSMLSVKKKSPVQQQLQPVVAPNKSVATGVGNKPHGKQGPTNPRGKRVLQYDPNNPKSRNAKPRPGGPRPHSSSRRKHPRPRNTQNPRHQGEGGESSPRRRPRKPTQMNSKNEVGLRRIDSSVPQKQTTTVPPGSNTSRIGRMFQGTRKPNEGLMAEATNPMFAKQVEAQTAMATEAQLALERLNHVPTEEISYKRLAQNWPKDVPRSRDEERIVKVPEMRAESVEEIELNTETKDNAPDLRRKVHAKSQSEPMMEVYNPVAEPSEQKPRSPFRKPRAEPRRTEVDVDIIPSGNRRQVRGPNQRQSTKHRGTAAPKHHVKTHSEPPTSTIHNQLASRQPESRIASHRGVDRYVHRAVDSENGGMRYPTSDSLDSTSDEGVSGNAVDPDDEIAHKVSPVDTLVRAYIDDLV